MTVSQNGDLVKPGLSQVKNQYIAVFCVNLISIVHGASSGWMSPAALVLQSDESPMSTGPLSLEEISWVGALINIGGILGNFMYSVINKNFGRKIGLILLPFPNIICWLLLIFTDTVEYLYVARIVAGITGGGTLVSIPLFVAEIASNHVRGTLGFYYSLSMNAGALLSFILGSYVPYKTVPMVLLVFPILYSILIIRLPETPAFLLEKNRMQAAENSLRFYRNCSHGDNLKNEEQFQQEFKEFQEFVKQSQSEKLPLCLQDIINPIARRGLLIGTFLMTLNIFSGGFILAYYTGSIFEGSGSKMDSKISSILSIAVQLLGTYLASFVVDKLGRKIILMISTFGTSLGLCVTATFMFLATQTELNLNSFAWIPVVSLSSALFFLAIGIMPLSFVVVSEVVPARIRSLASTYCMLLLNLILFIASRFFLIVAASIGLYSCIWLFSAVSFSGFLFAIFILPETKGKKLNI